MTTVSVITVKDATGTSRDVNALPNLGRAAEGAGLPVTLSNEDAARLDAVVTALQGQRESSLWTDDTNSYFVRVDNGTTIAWLTISGTSSSAPSTGARPVSGLSAVVDKSSYQATAGGTGYSSGDLLDHIVTTDPTSGVVIGHFWLNTTTEAKLASSPSSGNITPLSPLATGASTSAKQDTGNTSLSSIDTKLPALSGGRVPVVTKSAATTATDASGSLTAGGTAQSFLASDSTRLEVVIGNPDATESLWFAPNGITALAFGQGSFEIRSGGSVTITGPAAATAISWVAATTGHKLSGWRTN